MSSWELDRKQGGIVRNRKGNLKSVTLDAPATSSQAGVKTEEIEEGFSQSDVFLMLESRLADGSVKIISPSEHRAQMEQQIVAANDLVRYAEQKLKGLSR
jgi:hypothetical protein